MILRIDHVSLAVKDYEKASHFFTDVLGAVHGQGASDDSMKYFWQIFSMGDLSRLELQRTTGEGSYLDGFLKNKKDGGVHHITLQTSDIRETISILEKNNIPYFGFADLGDVWKEVFIHPRDAFGVLIQIAELEADDWLGDSVKFPKGQKWSVEHSGDGCILDVANPGGGKTRLPLTKDEVQRLVKDLESVD
jgi:methylmalonyl-CoA/ethylmalonyl-CoA epimerase